MAHFLEHLVFKGGEKFPHYRDVNETAETLGGSLNAYTSHDLVAFHITVRAEAATDAADLLTDFVGRPHLDAEELDRERGVVIQEIQRYKDEPSSVAEELIDRAAFGEHPLGRPVLGPEEHLRTFTRDAMVAFRNRRWAGPRGGAFVVGNLEHVPENGAFAELFERFPQLSPPEPFEPAPAVRAEGHRRGARDEPVAPADVLPPEGRRLRARQPRRAVDLLDPAGRLDELAPVRRDPRAARPRLLRLRRLARARRRPAAAAQRRAGLDEVHRGLHAHARDRRRAARRRPDRGRGDARPRLRRRPPRPGVREHERRRALRRRAVDRVRREDRSRRRDRGAGRRHDRRGHRGRARRRRHARDRLRRSRIRRPTSPERAARRVHRSEARGQDGLRGTPVACRLSPPGFTIAGSPLRRTSLRCVAPSSIWPRAAAPPTSSARTSRSASPKRSPTSSSMPTPPLLPWASWTFEAVIGRAGAARRRDRRRRRDAVGRSRARPPASGWRSSPAPSTGSRSPARHRASGSA